MPAKTHIQSYKDLRAWELGIQLAQKVYEATKKFPKEEMFGLACQMRRAAVSIPSNIAEGYGRGGRKEYLRFLRISRGSLNELETQLYLSEQMGFVVTETSQPITDILLECSRVLQGLIQSIENVRRD